MKLVSRKIEFIAFHVNGQHNDTFLDVKNSISMTINFRQKHNTFNGSRGEVILGTLLIRGKMDKGEATKWAKEVKVRFCSMP